MLRDLVSRKAYIGAMEYALGDERSIASCIADIAPAQSDMLSTLGFDKYCQFEYSIDDLARIPIAKLLDADNTLAGRIDAVIIAQQNMRPDIVPLLRLYGARDIPIIQMGGMDCASLALSIAHASLLVSASIYDNVLCCFATKTDKPEERILFNGMAFSGDGAACCIISKDRSRIEVRNFKVSTNLEIYEAGDLSNQTTAYLDFSVNIFDEFLKQRDNIPFHHLIALNFPFTNSLFVTRTGPACGELFQENVPKYAHITGADILINLKDKFDSGGSGDVLIVGAGPHSICMIDVAIW